MTLVPTFSHARPPGLSSLLPLLVSLLLLSPWLRPVEAMSRQRQLDLREEAREMFRHGWENYWDIAFPEDEVKPLTCVAHHRDRANPKNIGQNDAMGEFSLTAIDSLSTLALMAASSPVEAQRFWDVVEELIRIYWYNSPKPDSSTASSERDPSTPPNTNRTSSWGRFQGRSHRTRGFDIDAKVQVFETTIRGLGGLLSAHLFATNVLPSLPRDYHPKFTYKNELLYLAEDLGRRLLPALTLSPTGIPYPRVNLRHGLPHGIKNPWYYNRLPTHAPYHPDGEPEHPSEKFWQHAKSVKKEKPDEEITETCTAGAGSLVLEFTTLSRLSGDPVFEQAAKRAFHAIWKRRTPIGLVGSGIDAETGSWVGANSGIGAGVDSFFEYAFKSYVLLAGNPDEGYYLDVWEKSRAALERHVLVKEPVPWWNNVHVNTGAGIQSGTWIDSLGGFFAGTLSAAGGISPENDALDLAVRGNLVYAALWTRYNALPERYNTRLSTIEGGLTWYPGRPEFIESTYLLYRATKDPFWLYVGEMAMRDLKRRCKARCGWAGLQDVRTGQRQDRMESFWLSETWKYLFLLFDEENPLHKLDTPWVFTTEGHPIIIPKPAEISTKPLPPRTCARPPESTSFFSTTASRDDLFHAAFFTKLHQKTPNINTISSDNPLDLYVSPCNSTYYPYTLPPHLIPPNATCAPLPTRDSLDLIFPEGYLAPAASAVSTLLSRFTPKVQRVNNGLKILSLDSLRLSLTSDDTHLRISKVAGISVGRGETVYVDRSLVAGIDDINFEVTPNLQYAEVRLLYQGVKTENWFRDILGLGLSDTMIGDAFNLAVAEAEEKVLATVAQGAGALPVLDIDFGSVYVSDSTACDKLLPKAAANAEVVVVKRGGCTFSDKVSNVPDSSTVKLVVVEDYEMVASAQPVVERQMNRWGRNRRNRVQLVMVPGGVQWNKVQRVGLRTRVKVMVQGRVVGGLEVT
ncbi:Similar to ER degradation-enhancing alpha-mannosidase-like protein 1; acc. no. O94726 [Pyronema omphalodes CBS 100304]|uniref:alpha-1,2-Mannosidase n=1 Tax=Pyronema omphalodes (strain CBS 100304) TaxID=1076935 RepID=U4LSY5_PYROM|nr:Similar to ER degradation-enhancing alpha-mannosidase-like protein 1; acc. no. O94726 [Pyronema omphalodes CBS 100304]